MTTNRISNYFEAEAAPEAPCCPPGFMLNPLAASPVMPQQQPVLACIVLAAAEHPRQAFYLPEDAPEAWN